MNDLKTKIKETFLETTHKKIKSIEQVDKYNFIINDSYIIRILDENNAFINVDDINIMYSLTQDIPCVEKIVICDKESNLLITKAIHRKEKLLAIDEEWQLSKIAKALKRIHSMEAFDFLPSYNIFSRYEYNKSHNGLKVDGRYEGKIIRQIKKIIENQPRCICHNNLSKETILFGYNDISLLDLTEAGLNYYQFDLAKVISSFRLDEKQIECFLKSYFGKKYSSLKAKKIAIFVEFLQIF